MRTPRGLSSAWCSRRLSRVAQLRAAIIILIRLITARLEQGLNSRYRALIKRYKKSNSNSKWLEGKVWVMPRAEVGRHRGRWTYWIILINLFRASIMIRPMLLGRIRIRVGPLRCFLATSLASSSINSNKLYITNNSTQTWTLDPL